MARLLAVPDEQSFNRSVAILSRPEALRCGEEVRMSRTSLVAVDRLFSFAECLEAAQCPVQHMMRHPYQLMLLER